MTTTPAATTQERFPLPPTGRVPGAEPGAAPSAGEVLAMLRRRIVMIIVLFFLFSAMAVGGFVAWWVYFPGYEAESLVECVTDIPETELTAERERLRQEEHERFVRTQAVLLMNPIILGEALKINAVRETQWYRSIPAGEQLLELEQQLQAAPVRSTNFLRVALETRQPEDGPVIVNAVVNQWLELVRRRTAQEFATEAIEDAGNELTDLQKRLAENRDQLRRLSQQLPPGAANDPAGSLVAQQVAQYSEQVANLELQLSQLEQYLQIYSDPAVPVTAEDRAIVEQDPQVAQLAQTVFLLEQQMEQDRQVYGPGHRVRKQAEALLDAARKDLEAMRVRKLQERKQDLLEAFRTAYANTQNALLQAQNSLSIAQSQLEEQDTLLLRYQTVADEIKRDEEREQILQDYISSRRRVLRQQRAVQISVAQEAIVPLERSSPSLLVLPAGVMLALAMSVGIALLRELLDTSVRSPQDITRHLNAALLGVVPDIDDEEVRIQRAESAVLDAPRSMMAEAFRRVRTNLQFSAPAERQRLVLVTSPRPEDGKTTVAANLAAAIAQGGRRVLLIDANLRRPHLQDIFPVCAGAGLSNILVGESSLESCVRTTSLQHLDVLGAGRVPPNPVELLDSPDCRQLLARAAEQYDQVILDTSPVLLASDGLVLGTMVDGVILVVRAKANSRGAAARAANLLIGVGARPFGVVLNAAQVTRGGYFREQLRSYYDYQAGAEKAGADRSSPSAKS
ncbi:MAG: polysaccharide biosynthesis tyrosine autokinase [Phycisphaerae bacterium]|nr:polysaccharide biosynthesis tyrosine autokinase [Phycisphaerae bacterium]